MQIVREATRASASDHLIFYLTRPKIMKMIRRGSKADEPVLAIGEATEGASTKIQKNPFPEEKDDTVSQI